MNPLIDQKIRQDRLADDLTHLADNGSTDGLAGASHHRSTHAHLDFFFENFNSDSR